MTVTENAQCELQGMFSPTFGKASAHQICLYSYKSNVNTIYEDTRCCASLSLLSVLWKRYLKKVRVIAMCVLQLNCSDMQIGTDLLRRPKKRRQSKCQTLLPWTGDQGCRNGWVGTGWWGALGLCIQANVQKHTLVHLFMCGCVHACLYMQLWASSDITMSQLAHSVTQPSRQMHTQGSQALMLNAWRGRGCLVLLWGPKPVNDAGHQKPHRWLI